MIPVIVFIPGPSINDTMRINKEPTIIIIPAIKLYRGDIG